MGKYGYKKYCISFGLLVPFLLQIHIFLHKKWCFQHTFNLNSTVLVIFKDQNKSVTLFIWVKCSKINFTELLMRLGLLNEKDTVSERRDIRSNIPLRLKEFPRAKPEGTPKGGGVYSTVYPESSPNTDIISL